MSISHLIKLLALFACSCIPAQAATLTWTGANGGGNWYDAGNWDVNGPPSQGTRLGTPLQTDIVIFDSTTAVGGYMPTQNILVDSDWSSTEHLQPTLQVLNGTINFGSGDWWMYGGSSQGLIIGDGDTGTLAQVNSGHTNWTRHIDKGGPNRITIHADGTMNQTGSGNFQWSSNGGLDTQMILNGGTFTSSREIRGMAGDAGDFVRFDAIGSSFTAEYGDGATTNFLDLTAVNAEFGASFINNTVGTMVASDNGDGSFTVSVVPEPGSLALLGIGSLMLGLRRRR